MAEKLSVEEARRLVGALSLEEAEALLQWCASLSADVERFPRAELKGVEPPLRSTPGPLS
jgi:hypothetical protein